ncbi:hypothetical protein FFLO_03415 [Filobasidium floriforme]|uniref:peptidylprolyl isomerase n=1 Tax=Filobasidium floriforme TaxID=5210 RepID=A0A8K0JKV1_9TREE|nr:hypothetical protein FFLO_03415 [Filobasidium floriforme]
MTRVYLDIAVGSQSAYDTALEEHLAVTSWLNKNASTYGLPSTVDELDEVGRETVESCFTGENPGVKCRLDPPESLIIGRLHFDLSASPNLVKQTENFTYLLTAQKSPGRNKKGLCYKDTPMHRFVEGFVLQGGDVIRGDGSGGESIYGGTLPDPKPPHQPHTYGSLSYASSSSKNSSTSQFFITLSPNTPAGIAERKKKLDNKYFPFGQLVSEDEALLKKLEERLGGQVGWDGMAGRGERCWVAECGVC